MLLLQILEQIPYGWYKWKADLDIDLKVEGLSDIYLESVTITGHTSNDNCAYFVFDIDKFDIDANSNNSFLRDKIVVQIQQNHHYMNQDSHSMSL